MQNGFNYIWGMWSIGFSDNYKVTMADGDNANMQLRIWDGDWGIPSVDHKCLSVMVSIDPELL